MYQIPDTREEAAAKIPALHVMMAMGWEYVSPEQALSMRGPERNVLLRPILKEWLERQKHNFNGNRQQLPSDVIDKVIREISAIDQGKSLLGANEEIYKHLIYGITVDALLEGKRVSLTVPLIDWENIEANRFHATEELSVERRKAGQEKYRPDIVGYVNGIPLAVIEAKRPISSTAETAMVDEGISQHLRNQKDDGIQNLYAYSQVLLSISSSGGMYATTGTPKKFWSVWHEEEISESEMEAVRNKPLSISQIDSLFASRSSADRLAYEKLQAAPLVLTEQDRLIIGLLRPDRLLDMARRFIFFDRKAGKIIARHPQVHGTKSILNRVSKMKSDGSREGGVIWQATGSGKSKLMVLLAKALRFDPRLRDCRIIIITDRTDLERQISGTFQEGGAYGSDIATKVDGAKAKVQSGRELAQRIGKGDELITFTLLQKFLSATKHPECINTSDKMIVLVDEGHRSHEGENHQRMRKALPNAAFIAFTGTPLLKKNKTRSKFGPILHAYTMQDALDEGIVVPLIYEERKPIMDFNEQAIDSWFDKITASLNDKQKADIKQQYATRGKIYGAANRFELIALDISLHFENHFKDLGLKGQLATDSKRSAIRYKKALDGIGRVSSSVVMSPPDDREGHDDIDEANQPEVLEWWKKNVGNDQMAYEAKAIEDFRTDGDPDILIVVDKLLTGFDAPRNAVLYIDKHLKDHNLIQAISRVNRLHEDKRCGFLVDYRGILAELDTSIKEYQDLAAQTQAGYEIDDLAGTVFNISTEYKRLPALRDALRAIFSEVENKEQPEQYRRILKPSLIKDENGTTIDGHQKIREDFYAKLTEFGMCLKLALSSHTFFEDGSFDESTILEYKKDLRFFTEIRKQAKLDAGEKAKFSEYEKLIENLVDQQVIGHGIKEPEGVILIDTLGGSGPDDWGEEKTRNEADQIRTRIQKTIEQDLIDDPHAQTVFSEMLRKAITEAEALFDHPDKQYALFKNLDKLVREREVPDVPDRFRGQPRAKAYYGAFLDHLGKRATDYSEDALAEEAVRIDGIVDEAIRMYSINPSGMEDEIRKKMLPRYQRFFGNLEDAKTLAGRIIEIVQASIAKQHR